MYITTIADSYVQINCSLSLTIRYRYVLSEPIAAYYSTRACKVSKKYRNNIEKYSVSVSDFSSIPIL